MATVPYTEAVKQSVLGTILAITWSGLNTGDVGEAYPLGAVPDVAVQMNGSLGTFAFQGSCEVTPVNWVTLTNEAHTPITETGGARIEQVLQSPVWVRPNVSGAGAGVTVTLCIRKHPR